MNKEFKKSGIAGEVSTTERGSRVLLGGAAIVAAMSGVLLEPLQIFLASLFCQYMVMTAITGLDPVYAVLQRLSRRLGHNTGTQTFRVLQPAPARVGERGQR